ncbi:PucR family transcriptional regulator [Oceanobacillus saliphilus]|uniref:PucR family transcriptional regulator n=1 Tax=Oceanobacillus saliphilus TaxID=2925834 RepID=UPI00201E356F|nr:PucR family transcriptional regulator [Oceanobacillus saliphilus]
MSGLKVSIGDILARETFKQAQLIAGRGGLNREIKWTHILESKEFEALINGGELILTTGSQFRLDNPSEVDTMRKLIQKNAAGICIELGTHVNQVSPEIIEYLDKHDFPLIVFSTIVKFVDITQDLHTLIINQHHEMLHQIYHISKKFNELSLMPNGVLKILNELFLHFKTSIIFITDKKKIFHYPPNIKSNPADLFTIIDQQSNVREITKFHGENCTFFPIRGLGHGWGYLCIENPLLENYLDEFHYSIVDRAALAITQIMLRNRTQEERKQNKEHEMVRKLIHDDTYDPSIAESVLPAPSENLYYRLVLLSNDINDYTEDEWEEAKLQQSIMLRSTFKKYGFFPAISIEKHETAIITSFYSDQQNKKAVSQFEQTLEAIRSIHEEQNRNLLCGISTVKKHYTSLSKSYKEAKDSMFIQKLNLLNSPFHEEIGVYRILLEQLQNGRLTEYVHDYLDPLLKYDRENNSDFLQTLAIYLRCMGSKKETAEQLFIVRQTLYHRLEKIEELLDTNFMEPTYRQALELALSGYELLKQTSIVEESQEFVT